MDPVEILISKYGDFEKAGSSLREYSRFLDIHPSTLSKILAKKRGIPKAIASKLALKLFDNEEEQFQFVNSVLSFKSQEEKKAPLKDVLVLNDQTSMDMFLVISQWEYFAILNVLGIKNFDHSYDFIAQSLNLPLRRVIECVDLLRRNQLVDITDGKIIRTAKRITTTNEVSSRAIKLAHLEELEMAKAKIQLPFERQSFQSHVFKISLKDIPKVKRLVEKLYNDLDKIEEDSEPEEVFCLNSQLFALTHPIPLKKGTKKNEH